MGGSCPPGHNVLTCSLYCCTEFFLEWPLWPGLIVSYFLPFTSLHLIVFRLISFLKIFISTAKSTSPSYWMIVVFSYFLIIDMSLGSCSILRDRVSKIVFSPFVSFIVLLQSPNVLGRSRQRKQNYSRDNRSLSALRSIYV